MQNTKRKVEFYKQTAKIGQEINNVDWNKPHNPVLDGKEMIVEFLKLSPKAVLPRYENKDDAGMDLRSTSFYNIPPGEVQIVQTGLAIQLKSGTEAQVRSRSGLAAKHHVVVLNSPGTIDAGYRGEIKVILINHGKEIFFINEGDRIAQLVIAAVEQPKVVEIKMLSETERGDGGFGSTGIK